MSANVNKPVADFIGYDEHGMPLIAWLGERQPAGAKFYTSSDAALADLADARRALREIANIPFLTPAAHRVAMRALAGASALDRAPVHAETSKEIRVEKLRKLVTEFGSRTSVAQAAGTSAVYLGQILNGVESSTGTARGIGDALARKLESGCGKPLGWMDAIQATTASLVADGFMLVRKPQRGPFPPVLAEGCEWECCGGFTPCRGERAVQAAPPTAGAA